MIDASWSTNSFKWKKWMLNGIPLSIAFSIKNVEKAIKNNDKEALSKKLNIKACILCGMCSYTCTSKIHLTDYCRKAKKMAQ